MMDCELLIADCGLVVVECAVVCDLDPKAEG